MSARGSKARMRKAQLIFVVTLAVGACSAREAPPPVALAPELFECPPSARAPAPPRLPRTMDQIINWSFALRSAWARTVAARDACAENLAAVARATAPLVRREYR